MRPFYFETVSNFDKASPVLFTSGTVSLGALIPENIVSDGVILVGDAASRPLHGCKWAATGMVIAAFMGRLAAEVIAKAMEEGDMSQERLRGEYTSRIEASLAGEQSQVAEAKDLLRGLLALNPEKLERAVEEIGGEMAALFLYMSGALPLRSCMETIRKWMGKE